MLERMWREGRPHTPLVGMYTGAAIGENSMEVPQNMKIELPCDPAMPLLSVCPKDVKTLILKDTMHPYLH